MSQSQPNPTDDRFDYEQMSDTEARQYLVADFGLSAVELWEDRNHIISPQDVLYYADAYGDLDDAILLQGWDKTLPTTAHKALLDSGYDIYEAVNCHDMETQRCASCDSDMWAFELPGGSNYTVTEWVDQWGNVTDDWVEYVECYDGHIWNAKAEEDHAPVLCSACSHDVHYDFPRRSYDSGSVRVHYGETDEVSGFSVSGNLVRWDFEAYFGDRMTDLGGLPGEHEGLPTALVNNSLQEWLDENGWEEIAFESVKEASQFSRKRACVREYEKLASEWAESDETHPDLDFTYVIDYETFGYPSFFVAAENRAVLLAEIVDLIDMRIRQ